MLAEKSNSALHISVQVMVFTFHLMCVIGHLQTLKENLYSGKCDSGSRFCSEFVVQYKVLSCCRGSYDLWYNSLFLVVKCKVLHLLEEQTCPTAASVPCMSL